MPHASPLILTIAVLATVALAVGGVRAVPRDRTRGLLMIAAALVLLGNVLIVAWPR